MPLGRTSQVWAPLGFDWKIGIALLSSFAAREVMVSTMATVYNLGDADQTSVSLREKLRHAEDPRTGEKVDVPAKNIVTFKPGKEMEERVRQIPDAASLEEGEETAPEPADSGAEEQAEAKPVRSRKGP